MCTFIDLYSVSSKLNFIIDDYRLAYIYENTYINTQITAYPIQLWIIMKR